MKRISTVVGLFVGGILMLGLAAPAAAQVKVDFSGGYQYLDFLETGDSSISAGWGASVGVGNAWVKAIADIGGHHRDGGKLYMYQGGVEFSGKGKRVVPFARILTGLAQFSGGGDTFNAYVLTPEGGVTLMANDHVGAQVSVGFPIMMKDGDTQKSMRIFAGIVIRK